MAQVKIYGERAHLSRVRRALSDAVHGCLEDALQLPADKRFQRFIALDAADFVHPPDRTGAYTIVEISMFEGRSAEAKRRRSASSWSGSRAGRHRRAGSRGHDLRDAARQLGDPAAGPATS